MSLKGKTLFISGASRGIGLAIALRAARDGANVALAAKTTDPHPKLPGTIYRAAEEIEKAGGAALPLVCDIRDEGQGAAAVKQTAKRFCGMEKLINNAALVMIPGVDPAMCRTPDILADTAHIILNRDARRHTGHFYIDEEVLAAEGVTDLGRYAVLRGNSKFLPDLFLD